MIKRVLLPRDIESLRAEWDVDERQILVCTGGGCLASGALEIEKVLKLSLSENKLDIPVKKTGCMGPCSVGPLIKIMPEGIVYEALEPGDIPQLVRTHFIDKQVYEQKTHINRSRQDRAACQEDIDFYQGQEKIVLERCGLIDPLSLKDYIKSGGYAALSLALDRMSPEEVIEQVKESGLRGRGGAGFPAWRKWKATREGVGSEKFVLCNADEGDPGAFMDRSLLEGDPHSIIEGMALAAYAIGAGQGFIYVRAEYPLAVSRLNHALERARESGLLGKNILGSSFCFDIEIRMGSGAFVCGEETALIHSIEGKRGEPRPRPPFPAEKGLWGKPTSLNNVETYANIPVIIEKGSDWYASHGTPQSKGTKVFALAGSVRNTGLVEVPIGTPLGKIIYDIGGGPKEGKKFKAAQIGGPSGGCIPRQHLNVPLDYESLTHLGAIMGSGGLIVMDEDSCMVDVARFFLEFVQEESCGKCVPCRVGTKRMLEILNRICEGQGEEGDVEKLVELGGIIKDTALCGLGQTAPNPVLSTIRYFRNEYDEHIRDKHCRAGVCIGLVRAPCQSACPASVDIPGFISLVKNKLYAEALLLHRERNPFASVCARVCFHTCEEHCRRSGLDEAVSIRGIKRFMVDQEVTIQIPEQRENPENAARKIVIVGAGPAGLSCAYFLARMGYKPVIYESEPRPGGMLVQTIPAYRLPRETLAREIRMIERMGVTIETGKTLGKDFTIEGLKSNGVDCLFLGLGASRNMDMGIKGEDSTGVVQAIPFLKAYNIRGAVPVGRHVVVVGGGNAAIDAARTAIRLDAKTVTILYRRSAEQMPAYQEEIDEALHEGIKLLPLTQPVEILKTNNSFVSGVKCLGMKLGNYDRSGRRKPEESSQKAFILETDQIILALGQGLDSSSLRGGDDKSFLLDLNEARFIKVNPLTGQSSKGWIFAGGDAATGPASVVKAIAAGEKAAVGMDIYLSGENHAFWREEKENLTTFDPDQDPASFPREKIPLLDVARRSSNFDEVERCWTESEAIRQASRCLRCDYGKKNVSFNVVCKEDIHD